MIINNHKKKSYKGISWVWTKMLGFALDCSLIYIKFSLILYNFSAFDDHNEGCNFTGSNSNGSYTNYGGNQSVENKNTNQVIVKDNIAHASNWIFSYNKEIGNVPIYPCISCHRIFS
jgi:hypothetical protein